MLTQKMSEYEVELAWIKLPLASTTSRPTMVSSVSPHPRLLYPDVP